MLPSILNFTFYLILPLPWPFWEQLGYFESQSKVKKPIFSSTHVAEQILFSMFPSIFTFNFDIILELYGFFFWPNGLFLGSGLG